MSATLVEPLDISIARLERMSAGCDWLIGRWGMLGNGLSPTEEGVSGCAWADADLTLALDLLGRPAELRYLVEWPVRLTGPPARPGPG